MIEEVMYVIKTSEGYKAPKNNMVQKLNQATFYGTEASAQKEAKKLEGFNPVIIKLIAREALDE